MLRAMHRFCISRPQALWKRYILGFIFIFATISVSHWASLATITAAEDDAEVLSVSSRQRMLSQRIMFLMTEASHGHDTHIESSLEDALDVFEASHNALVSREDLSPELQALYFEKKPISLDAFSRRFVQMVGIASSAQGEQAEELHEVLTRWGTHELLTSLATASDLFRQSSEARIKRLQIIQKATLISALTVLLIEAILIFLPAQLSVNRTIHRLERSKKRLKTSMKTLRAKNDELVAARQALMRAANHDALTGLFNRRAVYEHMSGSGNSAQGGDFTRCILKLDLDLFKQVNDSLGHDAGDRVLVRVA
ncbi:diguanylate cyclase, partial [Roseobacter litoralis]|uniref:diguanylate cyclase n=1 Tax=Roseobacter litoralis TaxID=42443 RepID=UPI002494CF93